MSVKHKTLDANEAVAAVAYQLSEVVAIYPITPSSPMGEWADQWASEGKPNLWGSVPDVVEMQSEGGAAGAVQGALQAGVLSTTFTASQGLLLMIPNMYKIAGELTPAVFHVAARSLAPQGLSIFGDHSDVMAARATGYALLASNSVQEAADLALIAHAATLESRIPFIHFFDGFRTSHEIMRIEPPDAAAIRGMIDDATVRAHRGRALTPDRPLIHGTAQNPDVYFQARESVNPYYLACPTVVQAAMHRFFGLTGCLYHLFDYAGAPDAERVVVLMGSGVGAAEEAVEELVRRGEKVGVLKVRLYRPFSAEHFLAALPKTVKTLSVLDRTKEPGCLGEPLYLDVVAAVHEAPLAPGGRGVGGEGAPRVVGGRYGLSSKEFTPAMVKAVLDDAARPSPRNHFTVGIRDDLTFTSLDFDPDFSTEDVGTLRAVFYGLGSDGTVGANKNSIKIIGEEIDLHAQGYFVYDSKKAGSVTVSHLRFGPRPIRSTYLIRRAAFAACHQFSFLDRIDVLREADDGALFLLNSPYGPDEVWDRLPPSERRRILDKRLHFFVIDAFRVAHENGMGGRINTVMQTAFFALSGVLPREQAIAAVKKANAKTYGKRGRAVVDKNCAAVDAALARRGWAYDIGFGGVDHVLASGRNVNLLVLDIEVYSNTGGQMSKLTPRAAVAKFAAAGKRGAKKDLALIAMSGGGACVARVAMGANDAHTLHVFREAEAFDGPSLILAYSHCVAHGYDMAHGMEQQKLAVQTGYWPLLRYNPALLREGKNPLTLDSKPPSLPLKQYVYNESRYTMLVQSRPDAARELLRLAEQDVRDRWNLYERLAAASNKEEGERIKDET